MCLIEGRELHRGFQFSCEVIVHHLTRLIIDDIGYTVEGSSTVSDGDAQQREEYLQVYLPFRAQLPHNEVFSIFKLRAEIVQHCNVVGVIAAVSRVPAFQKTLAAVSAPAPAPAPAFYSFLVHGLVLHLCTHIWGVRPAANWAASQMSSMYCPCSTSSPLPLLYDLETEPFSWFWSIISHTIFEAAFFGFSSRLRYV